MNIALFGATGATGRLLTGRCLSAGYTEVVTKLSSVDGTKGCGLFAQTLLEFGIVRFW